MVKKLDKKSFSSLTAASLLLGGLTATSASAVPVQGFEEIGSGNQIRAELLQTDALTFGGEGEEHACGEGQCGDKDDGGEKTCGDEHTCGDKDAE